MHRHINKLSSLICLFCIRLLDIVLSTIFIIILLPLFSFITAAIKFNDGGPVFFIQERPGLEGNPFRMYKFRSMIVGAENMGAGPYIEGENDSRITKPGRLLRKASLDELPQLFNIIKGEMSLVGPRPGMFYHLKHYTDRQRLRLTVKPGLTGWAQINGRNSLSWPQRIEHDIWFIQNQSLYLYIKIILITFPSLFKKEGIYAERDKFLFNNTSGGKAISQENLDGGERATELIASLK
jgi:undecaprenyl phosphate N,N'-diacetylbacillosamine 1-phosphate transferase